MERGSWRGVAENYWLERRVVENYLLERRVVENVWLERRVVGEGGSCRRGVVEVIG